MSTRQRAILAAVAVVLGAQLAAQVAGTSGTSGSFWPFIPYPMYSLAHPAGSRFSLMELRILSPETGDQGRVVLHHDIDVKYFIYIGLLEQAARSGDAGYLPEDDDAARLLSRRIAERQGSSWSKAQVWERKFEIGEHGLLDPAPPLTLAREWSLPYAAGARE
jgi:hypothetical protein